MTATILFITVFGVMIGEGLTSAEINQHIEAGFRMFTIYTGPEACAAVDVPHNLQSEPVTLNIGDELLLTDLIIVAYSADGEIIPRVPIGISHDVETNDVLVRDPHRNCITYIANRIGRAKFSIAYLCESSENVETQLIVNVV